MPQPLSVFRTAAQLGERPGRVEIKKILGTRKARKACYMLVADIFPCFSPVAGELVEVLVRVLPFRRVKVPVIVSSLLRQRLGNNFAAQEEGKSQF